MPSRWDERYLTRSAADASPAAVLRAAEPLLHPPGHALDLACGLGGNAIALARLGFSVDAWDASPVAIQKLHDHAACEGLVINATVRDVIAVPPPADSYDVIVVSRFLERLLCPAIAAALRPDGLLCYQTFFGAPDGAGPVDPARRLRAGELPQLFAGLTPLVYREESATGEALLIARRTTG